MVALSRILVNFLSLAVIPLLILLVARLRRDYVKYDAEEREAADQLAEYQQRATEALAHLQRVCKLKQEVKERGDQVFSRGIEAIDAWDGVVQQEPIIGD